MVRWLRGVELPYPLVVPSSFFGHHAGHALYQAPRTGNRWEPSIGALREAWDIYSSGTGPTFR
jgi:hypothetical protein